MVSEISNLNLYNYNAKTLTRTSGIINTDGFADISKPSVKMGDIEKVAFGENIAPPQKSFLQLLGGKFDTNLV